VLRPSLKSSTCSVMPSVIAAVHYRDSTALAPFCLYISNLVLRTKLVSEGSVSQHKIHHSTMLTDQRVLPFGSLLLCLFLLYRIQRVKQVWQAFGNLPAYTIPVSPLSTLGRMLPRIPWISSGFDFSWRNPYERQPLPRLSPPTQLTVHVQAFSRLPTPISFISGHCFHAIPHNCCSPMLQLPRWGWSPLWSPLCSLSLSRPSFRTV
jgi:hypothetical protein